MGILTKYQLLRLKITPKNQWESFIHKSWQNSAGDLCWDGENLRDPFQWLLFVT